MEENKKKPEGKIAEGSKIVGAICKDRDCVTHGHLKARGRIFKGVVVSKFPKRIAIEFERMIYFRKYERYAKNKTKVHARLSDCMEDSINIGDLVLVQECRPLSKIIHFTVIGKADSNKNEGSEE
ncbi:MAG: 30S ribosomal protein S17 [Nanoarchaeota archaeon]|nr:30S ribosomal protein S17 [Nanoarchaeota archaeon]